MRTLRVACAAALLLLTRPCVLAAKDACNQTVASYEEISSPESTPGLPVTCWYRLRTTRKDLVLRIRFKRFKVGVLLNGTHCHQGFLQIVDGNAKTEVSNRKDPGMFCGEIEQPQTFISETSIVKILYHTDNYTDQTYFTFEARPDQQLEVYARYGHHPELYPNRRGEPVPGSYCERIFRDCRLQTCYVQSPAYPGVYPRGLYCRYHLNTRLPFIKLYIENEVFNIDGQRCENIMTCPMRPISSGTYNCPYDYIKIYDGTNETSPLIGTFCGMGHFPFSIIGSKQDLLVEFSSSAAGPLLNTGFHFNVGSWPGHSILVGERRGGCDWLLSEEALLASGSSEGIFQSVAHWYPPHTTCNYLIQARRGNIVRLYFPRINRIEAPVQIFEGDCGESLTLFDSSWADDSRIIKTFCDTFSKAMEKHDFVSTGDAMYVRFESKTGSYSGSSLYYWAHYDFFNDSRSGEPVAGSACDEVFASWQSTSGRLRSPINTLVYKRQPGPVRCSYRFVTDRRLFARVILTIESMAFKDNPFGSEKCSDCIQDHTDKLMIVETEQNGSSTVVSCLCHGGSLQPPVTVISRSEHLSLELVTSASHASTSYFKHSGPLFQARFEFVHPPVCGPAVLEASAFGHITFPQLNSVFSPVMTVLPVRCIWELQVHKERDVWLNFEKVDVDGQISISIPKRSEPLLAVDGQNFTSLYDLPVLTSEELSSGDGVLELKLELVVETWNERVNLRVTWTELGRVPTDARKLSSGLAPIESEDFRDRSEEYCEFFCPGDENYCIPNFLVCNSVANCPNASASADEAASLCSQDQDSAAVNWITVTVGGVVGSVVFLACFIVVFRACCCRRRRDKHHQMASRDMYMR